MRNSPTSQNFFDSDLLIRKNKKIMKKHFIKISILAIIYTLILSCTENKETRKSHSSTSDDSLVIDEIVYTGLINFNGDDKAAAIWIMPDSSYTLMTRDLDNIEVTNTMIGKIEMTDESQIMIPIGDTCMIYSFSESMLIPLNQDLSVSSQMGSNKYVMNRKEGLTDIVWKITSLNGENINMYDMEITPYIIFSNDSLYIYGNCGCNSFIGNTFFSRDNRLDIYHTEVKDDICLPDVLEREFLYMLSISDNYSLTNSKLILYHKNNPIGLFQADYLFYE